MEDSDMTDRYEQKKQRPWLQYLTLGIATLAMAFSAIAAFLRWNKSTKYDPANWGLWW